ncbi:FecR family protein [Chitinophaga agrisoli]|nr:FecR family protein [Chitinophaga agrisoli]
MERSCTEQERERLFAMMATGEHDATLQQMADEVVAAVDDPAVEIAVPAHRADEILSVLLQSAPRKQRRGRLVMFARWAAAILLPVGAAILYFLQPVSKPANTIQAVALQDLPPATHGAVLTLGDGSKLTLDSARKGLLASQGGARVMLSQGTLAYDAQNAGTVSYNTLSTPRGRLFQLVLPDGSAVWLNAASSITFPTRFAGNERIVTLTGEAYFDIRPDAAKPFRVKLANNTTVQVLGTAFNINAYDNESAITATLISGRVQVNGIGNNSRVLQPGYQASLSYTAAGIQVSRADTSQVLAWKNGIFNFDNADVQTVMKQLERWYNIEVQYENGVPAISFGGKMDRNLSLKNITRMLEISKVHCRLEGKKLIITE